MVHKFLNSNVCLHGLTNKNMKICSRKYSLNDRGIFEYFLFSVSISISWRELQFPGGHLRRESPDCGQIRRLSPSSRPKETETTTRTTRDPSSPVTPASGGVTAVLTPNYECRPTVARYSTFSRYCKYTTVLKDKRWFSSLLSCSYCPLFTPMLVVRNAATNNINGNLHLADLSCPFKNILTDNS